MEKAVKTMIGCLLVAAVVTTAVAAAMNQKARTDYAFAVGPDGQIVAVPIPRNFAPASEEAEGLLKVIRLNLEQIRNEYGLLRVELMKWKESDAALAEKVDGIERELLKLKTRARRPKPPSANRAKEQTTSDSDVALAIAIGRTPWRW